MRVGLKGITLGVWVVTLVWVAVSTSAAQGVEKYLDNGPDDKRLVLVITGDGYTASEQAKFRTDAVNLTNYLLSISPWDTYANAVNVYLVGAVSAESGADKPPEGIYVDTIFDATYWTGGIERLLTVSYSKVFTYVAVRVPTYDQIFVLVNDTKYGGSGGSLAVTSLHPSAREILVHEVGHSYAKLADEYYYNDGQRYSGGEPNVPNVTIETNRDRIKWRVFIEPTTPIPTEPQANYPTQIGLFEGAYYKQYGIYRPAYRCKMRLLGVEFCKVCKETHSLRIHKYVPMVDYVIPQAAATYFVYPEMVFEAVGGSFSCMTWKWVLDGVVIGNQPSVTVFAEQLTYPVSTLTLTVTDCNPWIPESLSPTATYEWTLVPPRVLDSIGGVKNARDGEFVSFAGVVSRVFSDAIYVQDPERSCGVRVVRGNSYHVDGELVRVAGVVDASGPELMVRNAQIVSEGLAASLPNPLAMPTRSIGGSSAGLQQGVIGASGLNNIGLLISTWGIVTYAGADYFYVDSGGLREGVKVLASKLTIPQPGQWVKVTGISSCLDNLGGIIPIIRIRDEKDIVYFGD